MWQMQSKLAKVNKTNKLLGSCRIQGFGQTPGSLALSVHRLDKFKLS
jgi:hypothetical protein